MDEGADMHSLLMTDTNTLIMGGLHNYIVEFDLNTVQETQKVIPSALWTLLIHRFPAYFESNIVSVCVCVFACLLSLAGYSGDAWSGNHAAVQSLFLLWSHVREGGCGLGPSPR